MNDTPIELQSNFRFPFPPNPAVLSFNYTCASTHPHLPLSLPSNHIQKGLSIERGKWSLKEQRLYVLFLEENALQIETKLSRKANKIFKKMSQVIKTRTADQCRSHHQKIINYHESVVGIIQFYNDLFRRGSQSEQARKNLFSQTAIQEARTPFYTITRCQNFFRIEIKESGIASYRL